MSIRDDLIKIQKRLVKRLKVELYHDYCVKNPGIDSYYEDYKKLTGQYEWTVNKNELITVVTASDVVYLGDYHTLLQSQKTLVRILEALPVKSQRPVILGLEMVQSKHQPILDKYLSGKISEKLFLARINYSKTWGFNWTHYRPILDYARRQHLKVVALNSSRPGGNKSGGESLSSLRRRDRQAAAIIADTLIRSPRALMLVLFGDLHISEHHLPKQVERIFSGRRLPVPAKLIVCQNSERIYWRLARLGEEQIADAVKIKDRVYCVMNSTPLAVFQSCIHWYNRDKQLSSVSADRDWEEKDLATTFLDEVVELVKAICGFMNLETPKLNELTVCTAADMELLKHIKKVDLTGEESRTMEIELLKTESYFVEKQNIICLTNFSMNHAAEQAAHFIQHYYIKSGLPPTRNKQDTFYFRLLREAMGFFCSKIINHKRMCYKEQDFQDFLRKPARTTRRSGGHQGRRLATTRLKGIRQISRFVVEHKKREQEFISAGFWKHYRKVEHLPLEEFIGISHALGYMLGNKLYAGVIIDQVSRSEVRELFLNPFKEPGEPLQKYLYLVQRLRNFKDAYPKQADHL